MSAATLHPQAPTERAASTVLGRLLVLLPPTAAIGSITVLIRPWRGIDLTDEMMYLLAASSGPMNFIHSPWGWHTGPLFRLVGQDVARFRVLGVVVLGLAAITLVLAARAFAMSEDSDAGGRGALAPLEIGLLSAGAVFWAGLFYLGLLRSPGHNWVAVVGLTLAAAGMLRCLSAESAGTTYRGVLILTAGLVFAAPARPGSVIIAGSVAIVTILLARSARAALHVMVLGAGYGAAAVLLLVIAGVWPANFPALFLRALRTPPLVDQSQLATAFLSYAMFPLDWVRAVTGPPGAGVVIALVLAGLLGVRVIAVRGPDRSRALLRGSIESARVLPVLALTLIAFIGSRDPALGFLGYGSFRWGTALVTAVVGGMLLMAVHGLLHATEGQAGRTRTAGIALALLAIAAANGLGTAGAVVGLTSNATGIVAVTLVILAVHGQRDRRVRRRTITVWAASGALAAGLLLTANAATPYRMVPLDEQVHAVRVLGADLLVDEATRDRFADVRSTAAAGGFRDGERLIPLTLPWSTFPPVALSAEVMPTLVPTIFQYGRSVEMGEFNLRLLDASWGDAWVLVDRDRRTGRYERIGWQVAGMEERLILGTGRMFPDDYVCVSEGEHVQLWLPITSSAGPAAGACRYVPPTP